jgi:hypothetical protein
MALLSFKKIFAEPVQAGTKRQTIRGHRKYPIVPGERLYLYTALRTKFSQKLAEGECTANHEITLNHFAVIIKKNGRAILTEDADKLNAFAKADGFESWYQLTKFWLQEHGSDCFPFHGTITYWKLIPVSQWLKPGKDKSGFTNTNPVKSLSLKSSLSGDDKRLVSEAHQLPRDNEGKEVVNG